MFSKQSYTKYVVAQGFLGKMSIFLYVIVEKVKVIRKKTVGADK